MNTQAAPATPLDRVRVLVVILAAIAQVAFGAAPFIFRWESTIADRSNAAATALTPAGYAFSIWSLLFAGGFAYSALQALPGRLDSPIHRRIGPLLAAAWLGNSAWEVWTPLRGFDWAGLALIASILATLLVAMGFTVRDRIGGLTAFAVHGLAGWVTVATLADASMTGWAAGFNPSGLDSAESAILLLSIGAILGGSIAAWSASISYTGALAWGLYAVHVASRERGDDRVSQAAIICVGVVALGCVVGATVRRRLSI
ncbi:MAG: hypothetical protein SFX72_17190 [Isosphaeraceae bacterium]|nr:hypothetical protein [Isosphaeraceae bacterium]